MLKFLIIYFFIKKYFSIHQNCLIFCILQIVNIPWMLLVEGDEILLRPGHRAPCKCISINGDILNFGDLIHYSNKVCRKTRGVRLFFSFQIFF